MDYVELVPEMLELHRLRQYNAALGQILLALGSGEGIATILDAIAAAVRAPLQAEAVRFLFEQDEDPSVDHPLQVIPVAGLYSPLTVPLLRAGQRCGTLTVTRGPLVGAFSAADITFAQDVAAQAVVAFDRAQRDDEAARRVARAEALREIAHELSAELDMVRFVEATHEQVARLIDYESCWVSLWDEDAAELDCRFYVADGVRRPEMQKRLKRGTGLAWALVDERRTLNVPDYLDECQRRGLLPTGYGDEPRTMTNPWLGVPLLTGGRLIGAMAVQRLGQPFSTEEATTLELLAVQIAATMGNARLYAEARQLACSDPLTGLANHRHLQEQLDIELARAARLGQPLAAIMADLNNFKLFNDTYGHPAGDQVLRLVAGALRAESRLADVVGRYGGDEFLLLLPGIDADGAAALIERVQARVATLTPLLGAASAVPLAFSAGVAVYPHDARTRHDLIALADSALYSSKRGGGRTVVTAAAHAAPLDLAADHTSFGVVEGLVLAVDAKDGYTVVHSAVVAEIATLLADELGLSSRDSAIVRTAGLLHDVGKISIPDRVLRKPGPLNKDEWSIMRQHVEFGELIIRGVPGLRDILDPVRHHHERWDGGGYPRGLVGESVPLLGRIMILADAYSAMILDRPYRRGLTAEVALEQIRAGAGSQFDPELAELLCELLERDLPAVLQTAS